MIDAKELRIGNYISFGNNIHSVNIIKQFENTNAINELNQDMIKPIPLTEEWLIKTGSERIDEETYNYDRFTLWWKKAYSYWYIVDKDELTYLTKIEFVHEWQNFVFIMNGEELQKN